MSDEIDWHNLQNKIFNLKSHFKYIMNIIKFFVPDNYNPRVIIVRKNVQNMGGVSHYNPRVTIRRLR